MLDPTASLFFVSSWLSRADKHLKWISDFVRTGGSSGEAFLHCAVGNNLRYSSVWMPDLPRQVDSKKGASVDRMKGWAMTKLSWVLVLGTIFVGSLVGGILAERLFLLGTVQAQKPNGVNAEEFLLLDQTGKARAGLGLDANGEVGLVLTSRDGNRTLALSPDGSVAVKLTDRSGRILWSAP
jgi:hypothetical protein